MGWTHSSTAGYQRGDVAVIKQQCDEERAVDQTMWVVISSSGAAKD